MTGGNFQPDEGMPKPDSSNILTGKKRKVSLILFTIFIVITVYSNYYLVINHHAVLWFAILAQSLFIAIAIMAYRLYNSEDK